MHAITSTAVITPRTEEPLTQAEVKLAAHITTTADDGHVDIVRKAAARHFERVTRRETTVVTYDYFRSRFPIERRFEIPFPPLASVTTVKYFDVDGVEQTLAATEFDTDITTEPGTVFLKPDKEWPEIQDQREVKAVTVRFVAGLTAATMEDEDKQAILFLAVHWLENREAVMVDERVAAVDVPLTWMNLVNGRKIVRIM